MKAFIAVLIIATLLQTSFVPINLVLLLLISRSLLLPEKQNLYLGLIFGVLIGILSSVNIGFYAAAFLICVELTFLARKTPLTINFLTVIPVSFALLLLVAILEQLFLGQTIDLKMILIQALLFVVIFEGVKFWEERFNPAPHIKLKI